MAEDGYDAGRAWIDVVPSFRGVVEKITAEARKWGQAGGQAYATAFNQRVRSSTGSIDLGPGEGDSERQGQRTGGAFANGFKRRVDAALRSLPDVKIDADSTDTERKIAEIRAQLDELSGKTIGVDLDEAAAMAKLDELRASLDELGSRSPSVQVAVDAGRASAELAAFQAEVNHLDGQTATVNVRADTSGLSGLSGIGGIGSLVAGLAPLAVPLGGAALLGGAGIGAGAAAGLAGVGALAAGLSGITGAVKATTAARQAEAKAAATGAASDINAAERVKSAEQSLAEARANADQAAITAAEQVRTARQNLANTEREVADAQRQAAQRVAQAQQAERVAADQLTAAVHAQNLAREQAVRDLQDYANTARDAHLSAEQAALDLTDAQNQLADVQANPAHTAAELEQAQLNVARAQQAVIEANQQAARAAEDNTKAQAAGVNGDAGVIAASKQVAAARRAQRDATRQLRDAQRAQREETITGAQRIQSAEQGVTDAMRNQASSQRRSAYAITQAEQQVADAMRATSTASTSVTAAQLAQRQAYAKLTPEGRSFARFVLGTLDPALSKIKRTAQANLLPGLQRGIKAAMPLLPVFTRFVGHVAREVGHLATEAGRALTSPFWTRFFNFVDRVAGPTLAKLAHILGNLATGFAGIFKAAWPVINGVGRGLVGLTRRFADFGKHAARSSGFQSFLAYVKETGPIVASTIGHIFTIVGKLITGLAPLGRVLLKIIDMAANFLSTLTPRQLLLIAAAIGGLVTAIAGPGVGLVVALVALGGVVTDVLTHSQAFRDFVAKDLMPVFRGIWAFIRDHLVPVIKGILTDALSGLKGAFHSITDAIQRNKPQLTQLLHAFQDIARFVVDHVLPLLGKEFKLEFRIFGDTISGGIKVIGFLVKAFDDIVGAGKAVGRFLTGPFAGFFTTIFGGAKNGILGIVHGAVAGIKGLWHGLQAIFKAPISFLINTVLDNGLIRAWNWVQGKIHVGPHIDPIHITGFAGGGVIPGYSPGVDSVLAMVSPGEAILRPEVTRALGPDTIHGWNAAARAGRLPRYADGGVVTPQQAVDRLSHEVGGFLPSLSSLTQPVRWLIDRIKAPLDKLTPLDASMFGQLVAGVPRGIAANMINAMKHLASSVAHHLGHLVTAPFGGINYSSVEAQVNRKIGQKMAAAHGWTGDEWNALDAVWGRYESGWLTHAGSLNAAYGIPQALPASKMAAAGPDWVNNPATQIKWGLGYITGAYGHPLEALRQELTNFRHFPPQPHSGPPYGYDRGGVVPPGLHTILNGTRRPEALLTDRQWSDLGALARNGGTDGGALLDELRTVSGLLRDLPNTETIAAVARDHARVTATEGRRRPVGLQH